MRKMREVFLSASGFALAGFMLSVTPGLAQSESDSSVSSVQPSQNANEQQIPQSDSQAAIGQQPNCSANIGGGQAPANALGDSAQQGCVSSDRQALNEDQDSQAQSFSANRGSEDEQQARLGDESKNGEQALSSENPSGLGQDRDLDEQQAANGRYGSTVENGREADVQGSARDYDSDRDQQQAVNESEIHGQVGISGEQYGANPDSAQRADNDERAATGGVNAGEDRDSGIHGEALESHEGNEVQQGAAASGTLLAFGQIGDPDRVLVNAEVEDNMGMVIGHLSRIEHEGGQDKAMIMLHDRKTVGLSTEHFRFDPARNLLIADLSEDQIEQSAG